MQIKLFSVAGNVTKEQKIWRIKCQLLKVTFQTPTSYGKKINKKIMVPNSVVERPNCLMFTRWYLYSMNNLYSDVKFQILPVAMADFRAVMQCSLIPVYRRFKGFYCHYHQSDENFGLVWCTF